MSKRQPAWLGLVRAGAWTAIFCLAAAIAAAAQRAAQPQPSPQPPSEAQSQAGRSSDKDKSIHITPEQAKQLFGLVDQLIQFSSDETGLPIKSTVKRRLITRAEVESYVREKFDEDEGAKRLQKDEIVLKKFGLLDPDFNLKPFLLQLLGEQIEAFYDSKTKTVNLLDWVSVDDQKPVLAHELTHALQDQHSDLEKWDDQTPDNVSVNAAGNVDHVARDEMDTARDAVAEGQATAVMMDYILKPLGKSLIKDPEIINVVRQQMSNNEDTPVMARAPLMLSESLLFPYRDGLSFEQDVWMDQGRSAAFAGALDRPPTSSWEILNPRDYEQHRMPAVPLFPDIHPLVDAMYVPYDIGQMGELEVHILTEIYGGEAAARRFTSAWDGGIYWAGQLRSARTPAEQASTKSLAYFYLSAWTNEASAQGFADLHAQNLGRQYMHLKAEPDPQADNLPDGESEQIFSTEEGPVVITTRGKLVFVAESFPLDLARKLAALVLDAQGTGEQRMAQAARPLRSPAQAQLRRVNDPAPEPLSGSLIRFFADFGVMKSGVDAAERAGK